MSEPKLDRVLRALEAAHNAGKTEDARELAVLARSLQKQAVPEDPSLMGQVNRGIAEGVGGLVDFVNPFDKQMGSAKTGMSNLMESGGIDVSNEAPEGFFENLAYGTGAGASAVIPAGVGVKALQGAGGLVGQVARTMTPQMLTTGGTAAEIASAATSSAASGAAREAGYSPTVQQLAGITAGIGLPLAAPIVGRASGRAAMATGTKTMDAAEYISAPFPLVGPLVKGGRKLAKSATKTLTANTKAGRRAAATERLQDVVGGKDRAFAAAERSEASQNTLGLSPAQRTGDEALIALERATMQSDPAFAERITKQMFESDEMVRNAIQSSGDVRDTQAFVAQRQAGFGQKIDELISAAEASARKKIPVSGADPMQASNIVAGELRKARDIAKEQQRFLWDKIPESTLADMSEARDVAQSMIDGLNVYSMNDAPEEVITFLKSMESSSVQKVGEMGTLSSKLREAARNATSGEKVTNNTARIANKVANAIDVSFDRISPDNEVNGLIMDARKFSREMHEKFSKGTVGRLLKRGARGDDRIDPELTLQKTMGQGGDVAAIAERDISTALAGGTGAGPARNATAEYLRSQFKRKVFSGDKYSETSAINFVNDNKTLLDKFPEIKTEVQASIDSQSDIVSQSARAKAISSKVSSGAPAKFAASSADKSLDAVFNSESPTRAMSSLVATAKKDRTGKALAGLKSAVGDKLLSNVTRALSKTRGGGIEGAPQVETGAMNLSRYLSDDGFMKVMSQVYSKPELGKLKVIAKELENVDRSRLSSETGSGLDAIAPNAMVSTIARVLGAKLGARISSTTFKGDIQTPYIFASKLQGIVGRLANDKPAQLIKDSLEDNELFKDLLRGVRSVKDLKQMERILAPYLVGTVAGQPEEEEEQ
jgi:hypothetical protein